MSGLVRVRYWRAPTMLRYSVASERGAPSYAESFEPDARGVGHGLESCIWVRVSRSKVYLVWVKTRAVDVRLASIPKKKWNEDHQDLSWRSAYPVAEWKKGVSVFVLTSERAAFHFWLKGLLSWLLSKVGLSPRTNQPIYARTSLEDWLVRNRLSKRAPLRRDEYRFTSDEIETTNLMAYHK